jgi:hypothetical protein
MRKPPETKQPTIGTRKIGSKARDRLFVIPAAAAIGEGRVFRRIDRHGNLGPRSDRALADIVVARAAAAGLDGDFAGHSLRAGFATAATRAGRSAAAIMCPRALEERADRPPLHPPGRPLGR